MTTIVLDASAVLAVVRGEPGADLIGRHVGSATISAVNLQEVYKELLDQGLDAETASDTVAALDLEVMSHGEGDAMGSARLASATKRFGRGLGDRSCMALAIRLGVPALTTDRAWAKLDVAGLQVIVAR